MLRLQAVPYNSFLLRQRERAAIRDGSEETSGGHVSCSRQGSSTRRAVERHFDRPTQWKLILTGERHCIFRNDAGGDLNLDTSSLRMCKDKRPGDRLAILVQRELRGSLPLVLSACGARLNCSLPYSGDIWARNASGG